MEKQEHTGSRRGLFADRPRRWRYLSAMAVVVLMVGVAERTGEREVIFPEMAALAIGMWIAPKRVWNVTRLQLVLLMGAGAVAGVCIVRWSPWPLAANLALAFAFAAGCLSLSLIVVAGQRAMERGGLRPETHYDRPEWNWRHDGVRWMWLLLAVLAVAVLPLSTGYRYCILPPLIVTFVEFANSKSGFRNRPVQVWLMLVAGATAGTLMEWMGHVWLGWSESVVALVVCACLFVMFERVGRYFAPVGAVALIPMIVPPQDLFWLPVQIACGAAVFIAVALLLFQRCYEWNRGQFVYCVVPSPLRRYIPRPNRSVQDMQG
ncbi:HPP family protein [Alistipes indistinctus]|uniref:HPP family protein n=1 Tax=Alistipes indistinctus TaxID=626932 RepID=UPI00243334A4|nr:HPP family protein [Alistipes indistinctus]